MFGVAAIWVAVVNEVEAFRGDSGRGLRPGIRLFDSGSVLDRLGAARVAKLRRALPAALDLLVLAVEAGQGLDAAILDTSRGLRATHPELASEFTQLHLELKANTSRADALQEFCHPQPTIWNCASSPTF